MLRGGRGEGWSDSPRLVANITSPLGATNATALIFLLLLFLPSPSSPPSLSFALVGLLLACQSVSIPVRSFVSVGLSGGPSFFLSWLAAVTALLPPLCLLSSREPSCIQNICACLDAPLICRPCPPFVLCLFVLLCPIPPHCHDRLYFFFFFLSTTLNFS